MAILSNLGVMLIPPLAGLEILLYITAVKIFACLDLEQNISFLDGHSLLSEFECFQNHNTFRSVLFIAFPILPGPDRPPRSEATYQSILIHTDPRVYPASRTRAGHYSCTPILPQRESYIHKPLLGVTQSQALWTRIFTSLPRV
jgi:hypothetical protein